MIGPVTIPPVGKGRRLSPLYTRGGWQNLWPGLPPLGLAPIAGPLVLTVGADVLIGPGADAAAGLCQIPKLPCASSAQSPKGFALKLPCVRGAGTAKP